MYSKEQKLKAVLLYIKYGCRASATVRELGYSCRYLIREWYLEYREKGEFVNKKLPKYSTSKFYSMDQMRKAVNFYLEHGKNLNLAVEVLGYPSRPGTLSAWTDEFAPGEKRVCKTGHAPVEYTQEVKE